MKNSMLQSPNFKWLSFALLASIVLLLPDCALASGISEFEGPIEKVAGTITGPMGKWIGIIAMALCGTLFIMQREDITGGMKLLLSVAFGISFISFAASIVNSMFSFTGALIS